MFIFVLFPLIFTIQYQTSIFIVHLKKFKFSELNKLSFLPIVKKMKQNNIGQNDFLKIEVKKYLQELL